MFIYLCISLSILYNVTCQQFIVPEYVRADEYGTAYYRAPAPKIGPTKSVFHVENLIKLESELIGLGEIILETEAKIHSRAIRNEDKSKTKNKTTSKSKTMSDDSEDHIHDFSQESRYLEKMREINNNLMEEMDKYTGNPLAMFPIRKRLAHDWPEVLANITNCSMVHDYPAINEHFRYLKFFLDADGDITVAYEDLLRLQKVYRIPVSSLARGWWGNHVTTPLNITDIIAIADMCLDREDMEGALEWLLQVAKLVKGLGLQGKEKMRYMNILGSAYLRLGKLQEARMVYNNILKEDPKNRIAQSNIDLVDTRVKEEELSAKRIVEREKEAKLRKAKKMMGKMGKVDVKDEEENEEAEDEMDQIKAGSMYKRKIDEDAGYVEEWWMKFCRGDVPSDPRKEQYLYCHYKNIPIMGKSIRVEVLSTNPPVYLLKDVLTDNMMTQAIQHASEEMEKRIHAYTVEDASTALVYSDGNLWMEPFMERMRNITYQTFSVDSYDRVNLMSAIRMYNVGAGGTSNPGHAEMKINRRRPTHVYNFIGRYIHFMKAPEEGGAFVFPWAGITVKPEKGDVLFWQFRTPKGGVNKKLYHWLECPIMTGDMWYAEQTVEHHKMIKKVDFDYVPEQHTEVKETEKITKSTKSETPTKSGTKKAKGTGAKTEGTPKTDGKSKSKKKVSSKKTKKTKISKKE